jgi:hypothetical protein
MGDVSSVFPPGVSHLADMPYTLHEALRSALGFLAIEELPDDERPDRSIWLEGDLMKAHWDMVRRKRKLKFGGKDDDDLDGPEERNELLTELTGGRRR